MKKFFFFILLLPISLLAQTEILIGNGSVSPEKHPFYGLYDYSQNMYIYKSNELGDDYAEIYELYFDLFGYSEGYEYNNLIIKMAHISNDYFPGNTTAELNHLNYTDLTTVVSSYDLKIDENDWIRIPFNNMFTYNGSDNLLIIIENHDGTWSPGFGAATCFYDNEYNSWYSYRDNYFPSGTGTRDKYRPNLKLGVFTFDPLPITLTSFSAYFNENLIEPSVEITWSTASEQNNEYFSVRRSLDGSSWEEIAIKNGGGHSTQTILYNYTDAALPLEAFQQQEIYYQLSQTDTDGTTEYFDIAPVKIKPNQSYIIKSVNLMGQTMNPYEHGVIIQYWNNGETTKIFKSQ